MSAFRAAQVSFLVEGGLQLKNLLSRKDGSSFLFAALCVQGIAVTQATATVRIRVILFRIADHQFVLVVLDDPEDPTPYWHVSAPDPEAVLEAFLPDPSRRR